MKISELQVSEAKSAPGKLGMLMDAHRELGINFKWYRKSSVNDEIVTNVIKMMNSAVDHPNMGKLTSPAYPLNKVADGFKKLGSGTHMFDINSGLKELAGLDGFLDAAMITKLRDALAVVASNQHGMTEHMNTMHNTMLAIMEIYHVALKPSDDYRMSISRAVLKNLGLHTGLNKGDSLGL